jgi:Putative MetA-pathway of phenol degradation
MRGLATAVWLFCAVTLTTGIAHAQERGPRDISAALTEREHFQLKLGAAYDQGDFGTSDTTRSVFAPITLRYLGEQFDVGVTAAAVYLNTESSVVVIDGEPTPTGRPRRSREVGFGDLVFRGRYYAVDDPGPDSLVPALAPFLKVKAPTGDASKGLGTGEWDVGFGLEFDKQFREFFLLGDVGFTFIGDPPGQNFRDRPAASLGIGRTFMPALAVIALLDWRRALVKGRDDPLELVGIVQVKVAPHVVLSPYVLVGLTRGSPDFGIGAELSWRFGRY